MSHGANENINVVLCPQDEYMGVPVSPREYCDVIESRTTHYTVHI